MPRSAADATRVVLLPVCAPPTPPLLAKVNLPSDVLALRQVDVEFARVRVAVEPCLCGHELHHQERRNDPWHGAGKTGKQGSCFVTSFFYCLKFPV